MSGKVWMSSLMGNHSIFDKPGLRTKFFGCDWNPAKFEFPLSPDEVYEASQSNRRGYAADRSRMPEAAAVFDEKHFARTHDVLAVGGYYILKERLAKLFAQFDLGEGGLVPFPIYKSDLATRYPGDFFLLNFGARKNTFLPENSNSVARMAVDRKTGQQIWDVHSWRQNSDVVVTTDALAGADVWFEETLYNEIFLSEALATALIDAGLSEDWRLVECRVAEAQS
jgi:hypothetical protein